MAIRRIKRGETVLNGLRANGYDVGRLKWKPPREDRSITYNQSGFDVDRNTGRTAHATVDFSKIGRFHLTYHRPLPEDGTIKQLHLKKQKTGEWTVSIVVTYDPEDCVGIDLGIKSFVHDSDGRAVDRLDLSDDRDRLEREQRSLSRKQHGSRNWERQRRRVAEVHQRMTDRKDDFKHKLAHFYTMEYDAVFVEDLDVREMLEADGNARTKADVGWRGFIHVLKHHGEKNGCHVVEVEADGTTKECARCGVETEKPLWLRTHSCQSCGFEADRDRNAVFNVCSRGLEEPGVVHSEGTPVETALPAGPESVPAKRVVEAGSSALKERTAVAVSE